MLSSRANPWSTLPQWHGAQNLYDEKSNPNGIVSFGNSENVRQFVTRRFTSLWPAILTASQFLMHTDLAKFINENVRLRKFSVWVLLHFENLLIYCYASYRSASLAYPMAKALQEQFGYATPWPTTSTTTSVQLNLLMPKRLLSALELQP